MSVALARDDLIARHMSLAASRTRAFLRSRPQFDYLSDDLESIATVELVEKAEKATEADSPRDYLRECIDRKLLDAVARVDDYGPSARTQKRQHKKGESIVMPKREATPERSCESSEGVVDTMDSVLAACRDETDREIVRMRIEGYRDREIGEQLALSTSVVHERRQKIEARYDELVSDC